MTKQKTDQSSTNEPVILDPSAIKALETILDIEPDTTDQPDKLYIRLAIRGGGCSGFQYEFKVASKVCEGDQVIPIKNAKASLLFEVLIDPFSLPYVAGTTVKYQDDLQGRAFIFDNPNARKTCSCNKSFDSYDAHDADD